MLLLVSNLLMVPFGIIGSISLLRSSAEAVPVYSANYCPNSTTYEVSNAAFRTNLNVLLSVLVANASQSGGFYASGTGRGTINTVDGQLLCRGDVSPTTCQECAAAAATEIKNRCPNKTESIIWYDECEVGYTNRYYVPTTIEPGVTLFDDSDVSASDLDSFNRTLFGLLERLGEEAAGSDLAQKFATGDQEFGGGGERSRVYGLAQCTPDLTAIECGECLRNATGTLPVCCGGKQGARALLVKCNVRYQLYRFYNTTTSGTSPPSGNKESARKIVLIVVLVVILIIIFCCACYFLLRKSRKNYRTLLRENFGAESATVESLQFSLATIETATRKFSSENKIGDGGFGEVYKGILSDGREIAVKKLSKSSGQGVIEFKNEIILIAKLQHRNLVALLGFCLEEQEKMLIYEFVPNKSLDYFLFDSQKSSLLNWFERHKIIEGIARGILYLHEHSRLKVIHRDLKPSNILLDDNMNPKISDFGMARIVAIDQNRGKTNRIVGTYGYMSPEYAMYGQFSEKSDVFSFGVIILEIISAKKNARSLSSDDQEDLLTYAWRQWRDQTPLEILDQDIKQSCNHSEVIKCIQIGLLCVQEKPDDRPTMANVVSYLSSRLTEMPFPGEPTNPTYSGIVQNMVAGSTLSINEMSVTVFIPR